MKGIKSVGCRYTAGGAIPKCGAQWWGSAGRGRLFFYTHAAAEAQAGYQHASQALIEQRRRNSGSWHLIGASTEMLDSCECES